MKANWLSNGLGGQSMYQLWLAANGRIPATLSITANTGGEFDRVCSNGKRMSASAFFADYVQPFAERHGIEALYIRTLDENDNSLPDLGQVLRQAAARNESEFDESKFAQVIDRKINKAKANLNIEI